MTSEQQKLVNKQLDKIDKMMSMSGTGEVLYQILSGSVRGPDTGVGKSASTMRLRRRCFPRTCSAGTTGMMNSDGEPTLTADAGTGSASGHFAGHASSAISYLNSINRKAWNDRPRAERDSEAEDAS